MLCSSPQHYVTPFALAASPVPTDHKRLCSTPLILLSFQKSPHALALLPSTPPHHLGFPSTSHCWDLPLCAGNWTLLTPKQKEAGEALEGGCECQGLAPCTDLNKRREKCCSPFCQPCSSRSAEQDHAGPWEKPVGKRLLFGFFQQPDGCCRPSALQGEAQTSFSLSHAIRGLANDGV